MKTLRLKPIIIAPAIVFAVGIFSGTVSGQATGSGSNHPGIIRQTKYIIENDIAALKVQRANVKALEQKYWDEFGAGFYDTRTESELLKARGDLERDRAYLKADKIKLLDRYQTVINNARTLIENERGQIGALRHKLNEDLLQGSMDAEMQAQGIVYCKQSISQHEVAIQQEKSDRKVELQGINREMAKSAQAVATSSTQPGTVNVQNTALK